MVSSMVPEWNGIERKPTEWQIIPCHWFEMDNIHESSWNQKRLHRNDNNSRVVENKYREYVPVIDNHYTIVLANQRYILSICSKIYYRKIG